jgi:hypothetical protein
LLGCLWRTKLRIYRLLDQSNDRPIDLLGTVPATILGTLADLPSLASRVNEKAADFFAKNQRLFVFWRARDDESGHWVPDDEREILLAAIMPSAPRPTERNRIRTYAALLTLATQQKSVPSEAKFFDAARSPGRFGESLVDQIADG